MDADLRSEPLPASRQGGMAPATAAAFGLHLLAAAILAAWPLTTHAPGERSQVVELVFAPPQPPEPRSVTPPPQPAPPAMATAKAEAPAPPPRRPAVPRRARSAHAPVPAPAPAPIPAADAAPPAMAGADAAPSSAAATATTGAAAGAAPTGELVPPAALDTSRPHYPRLARERGWEGVVVLLVEVGTDGAPAAVTVKCGSGHTILDQAAVDAARRWRFAPAHKNGQAIAARVEVPVRFSLSEG
ncbi:MAG: energy transducer TonB [Magnetospirillum sp.]|nr:energy transducer TonB [Magnetospirillum sp.]